LLAGRGEELLQLATLQARIFRSRGEPGVGYVLRQDFDLPPLDCSGHPSAGPEGIEMLRDGGTHVEMGQFTDGGSIGREADCFGAS
jgi:hypothetical protein